MPHPHTLTSLSTREAITDTLYRAVIAFDEHDTALFNSAFASSSPTSSPSSSDDVVVILDGKPITGLSSIRTQLFDFIGPMDTTHILSNIRIDVQDGANTASLTTTAMNMHAPAGRGGDPNGPKFLAGTRYRVQFVRVDGEWKVVRWEMDVVWRQGDVSVMNREG
ncbi:hypothetical protein DL98DRAFT_520914 [Cadophora sp. DSE1049]|nr:hypothetical protein DL98DRAFT_520914 [Cadophora sp. DSE1049]